MERLFTLLLCLLISSQLSISQTIAQFRGPDRNGVFPGTGLMKSWPESGPELLWSREDLDRGFSSVSAFEERPISFNTSSLLTWSSLSLAGGNSTIRNIEPPGGGATPISRSAASTLLEISGGVESVTQRRVEIIPVVWRNFKARCLCQ